jgi:esterase FrsA
MIAAQQVTERPQAASFEEFAVDPLAYASVGGLPDFLAARALGWVDLGADPRALLSALRTAPGPPMTAEWADHMAAIGERHHERANAAGDHATRRRELREAAFWFFLARWPYPASPAGRRAYERHTDAYLAAAALAEPPLEVLTVPTDRDELVGFLRVPAGAVQPPPVVLLSGGIDAWKSDPEVEFMAAALLERGLAVLAIDAPGTGQSPVRCAPGAEWTYRAMIDNLQGRADVDAQRLGFVGLSFGGHWAVKLALTEPRLRAVVNIAGPVHGAFAPDWLANVALGTLATLAATIGLDFRTGGLEALAGALARFSLVEQGVFEQPCRPALLSINGAQDTAVPIADLHLPGARGINQDVLIFARDRHCASFHLTLHLPFAAEWTARTLTTS